MTEDELPVGLVDQVAAAEAEGLRLYLAATAGEDVIPLDGAVLSPAEQATVDRIQTGLTEGTVTWCPHLVPGSAGPCWWLSSAGDRLRCRRCLAIAGQKAKRADRRRPGAWCDGCRTRARGVYPHLRLLPAGMHQVADGRWVAAGPILAIAGYCPACSPGAAVDGPYDHTDPG